MPADFRLDPDARASRRRRIWVPSRPLIFVVNLNELDTFRLLQWTPLEQMTVFPGLIDQELA